MRVLIDRAKRFSKTINPQYEATAELISYVRFRLGLNEFYGIPYQYAKEVMQHVNITPLPGAPSCIAGVINRRGNLIAILDLKKLFNLTSSDYEKDVSIIVITAKNITIGILADQIEGSHVYESIATKNFSAMDGAIKSDYILGLDNGLTAILNIEKVLSDPLLQQKR